MSLNVKKGLLEVVAWLGVAAWIIAVGTAHVSAFKVGHILGLDQRGYDEEILALLGLGVALVALLVLAAGAWGWALVYRRIHTRAVGSLDALFADLESCGVCEVVEYDGATVLRRKPRAIRRG